MTLPKFDELKKFGRLLEEQDRLPMLVTGIAGVAGYNAFAFFRQKYGDLVVGQRPKNNWPLSGPGIVGADLDVQDELRALLEKGRFKTLLNCGGSCALKGCQLDPQMAERVNVRSVESIVRELPSDVRLLHLSIDLVFAGTVGGGQLEDDKTNPVTVYGSTMVQAEKLILQNVPSACILRISLPMGISFNGHAGAIDWIESRFAKNKPATLYYDEVRTPVYVECLNETIERMICSDAAGVFHAGGTRRLSLYQIAQIVNFVGGYNPDLLIGCYRIEAGPIPPRAGNVSMESGKLSKFLGKNPFAEWPLDPQLVPNDRHWHFRRRGRGAPNQIEEQLYRRPDLNIVNSNS